jgi:RNA polymerase sigma factor (sigma-70 family)
MDLLLIAYRWLSEVKKVEFQLSKHEAEQLFREYGEYVYRTALFLTRSRTHADDIVQETFVRIYTKFHTYDKAKPIKPWIYKITINVTRNYLKKQRIYSLFKASKLTNDHSSDSLESVYLHKAELKELWELVNKLSQKSREILILHYYLELTLPEIAEILDIPLGTCKSRLHTALTQLRKKVKEEELFYFMEDSV